MSPDRLTHSNQSIHHYQLGVFGGGNLDSCTSIQAEQLYIKKETRQTVQAQQLKEIFPTTAHV